VLSVVLVKQDEGEIMGLTDNVLLQRVNKIQRFFNLIKEDVSMSCGGRSPGRRRAKPCTKACVLFSLLCRYVC
jgi:hypothetical protein